MYILYKAIEIATIRSLIKTQIYEHSRHSDSSDLNVPLWELCFLDWGKLFCQVMFIKKTMFLQKGTRFPVCEISFYSYYTNYWDPTLKNYNPANLRLAHIVLFYYCGKVYATLKLPF